MASTAGFAALALYGCATVEIVPPHLRPLSKDAMMLLGKKQMRAEQPIFVRIFKEESELEVWKRREDGRFYHYKTYPICHWSGDVGPKHRQGDKQAPEGFYSIARHQMNPNSQFYLAFNIGYPNTYDRANGFTGDFLMVHGKCKSAGCYAMTDALIEEIYALAREAFIGGQDKFEVHAFPFRLTDANMQRHKANPNYAFWEPLKQGYDYFEANRVPPKIAVCNRKYHVNVEWGGRKLDPAGACPKFTVPAVTPFVPLPAPAGQKSTEVHDMAPGPKMRRFASTPSAPPNGSTWSGMMGLGAIWRSN